MPLSVAQAAPLSATEFEAELVGRKMETRRLGLPGRLMFYADKRVELQGPVGAAAGTWYMSGSQVCITMKSGPQQGTRCGSFERIGNGRYRNGAGQVFTVR